MLTRVSRAVRGRRLSSALKRRFISVARHITITGPKVVFDVGRRAEAPTVAFDRLDDGRFYAFLLTALADETPVGCRVADLPRARECLPAREFFLNVRSSYRAAHAPIVLSETRSGSGIISINKNYYTTPPAEGRLIVPYFAHPVFYRNRQHRSVPLMREGARPMRVFFAGTMSTEAYSSRFEFPILDRDKILSDVMTTFRDQVSTSISETDRPIVMSVTGDTRDAIGKYTLSPTDYVRALSRAQFFICPPGWLMPHCHNMVEAMSVGTIPITNYHAYMVPQLTPGENCLAFSTLPELRETMVAAMRMPESEVLRMRARVIEYYDRFLDPESFRRSFMQRLPDISEIVVNDELGR